MCSSSELLVIAHGIPQLTIIATNQPVFNTVRPSLLNQCNVTVNSVQLPGPGTRRQERKISLSPQNTSVRLIHTYPKIYLHRRTNNNQNFPC